MGEQDEVGSVSRKHLIVCHVSGSHPKLEHMVWDEKRSQLD